LSRLRRRVRRKSAGKSERRGNGEYTHQPIVSEEPAGWE